MRRRGTAWLALAVMAASAALALLAPWPVAAALAVGSWAAMRRGRVPFLWFTAISVALNALFFGIFVGEGEPIAWRGLRFWPDGALLGVVGGLRLSAVVGANAVVLAAATPARIVEGMGLPRRAEAFVAAVLLAVQDLLADARSLRQARQLEGAWPAGRLRRVVAGAALVAPLMVAGYRRSQVRRDALRLAGQDTGPGFTPLVAITALAVAGRLLMAAVPNVAPTYLFVFLGGLVFGPWVGLWAGVLSMTISDFLLSGLVPTAFVNAPAMGLLGLVGGWMRRVRFDGRGADRVAGVLLAASVGALATLLFSVAADTLTWFLVPEFRGGADAWRALVVPGLAFNVLPAAMNAVLFALSVVPVTRAFAALRREIPVASDGVGVARMNG